VDSSLNIVDTPIEHEVKTSQITPYRQNKYPDCRQSSNASAGYAIHTGSENSYTSLRLSRNWRQKNPMLECRRFLKALTLFAGARQ
jgi:hypothetical protein